MKLKYIKVEVPVSWRLIFFTIYLKLIGKKNYWLKCNNPNIEFESDDSESL